MNEDLAGGRLTIDLGAIAANWRHLKRLSRPGRCAAVVKADAYGLRTRNVVPTLAAAGCTDFFVALPSEAVAVRGLAPHARVFVLEGAHEGSITTLIGNGLIPVLSSIEQVGLWQDAGAGAPCALHVDTGMNRLGVTVDRALQLASSGALRDRLNIVHVMSHLACADKPGDAMNRQQAESFQSVAAVFSGVESSLSNSAATLSRGAMGCSMTRPGIALYGGGPLADRPNPMQPVVSLDARIVQVRQARMGETVSYGAAQRLTRDTKIAVAAVGYADGYPRGGSSAGVPLREAVAGGLSGAIEGHRVPVLGRITMDLTCFDVTDVPDGALAGGRIELIGPQVALDDAAKACGTIGYELLTSLGHRYTRRHLPAEGG